MNLVLIHIGGSLPPYINDTIAQARKFYDGKMILVMNNPEGFQKYHFEKQDVMVVAYEDLVDHHRVQEFKQISSLPGFWGVTCERFFILESLMEKLDMEKVFHIENDVTIYNDPNNLLPINYGFCKDSIFINPTGPEISTGAFVYVDNLKAISFVNEKMLELLKNPQSILDRLTEKFISEMKLLNILSIDHPDRVQKFPILPCAWESTDLIFDCATWGQLLGGTPNGKITADQLQHHWVGREMYPERKYEYVWEIDDKGRRCPFIVDKDGNKYKFNNLHIHCKRISEFMS